MLIRSDMSGISVLSAAACFRRVLPRLVGFPTASEYYARYDSPTAYRWAFPVTVLLAPASHAMRRGA